MKAGLRRRAAPRRVQATRLRVIRKPSQTLLRDLSRLMASVRMRERDPHLMAKAIRHSTLAVAAYADGRLVGFGRLISDQTYYGSLWDIAVSPEFQRAGLGSRIVAALMEEARRRRLFMVGLFTDLINERFYERFGFVALRRVHAMRTMSNADSTVRKAS